MDYDTNRTCVGRRITMCNEVIQPKSRTSWMVNNSTCTHKRMLLANRYLFLPNDVNFRGVTPKRCTKTSATSWFKISIFINPIIIPH
ncbi:hypothetical protein HanPSC8_Chr09g0376941 [Helianthus annuus]|nr:hypothetical protein HanPSC8_Chr09g0376941 [Helianthus annuus]